MELNSWQDNDRNKKEPNVESFNYNSQLQKIINNDSYKNKNNK